MLTTEKTQASITQIAKILSDETRVRILTELEKTDGMCVYEISEAVGVSHSATSHQLAKLELAGIVSCYREGQKVCYELDRHASISKKIISALHTLA